MGRMVELFETDEGIAARENFKSVERRETLTWVDMSRRDFEIVFVEFEPSPGSPRQQVASPSGPFSTPLVSSEGNLTAAFRANAPNGTYFYFIRRNGRQLEWLRPIGTGPEGNFGGVEVHDPPPVTLPAVP